MGGRENKMGTYDANLVGYNPDGSQSGTTLTGATLGTTDTDDGSYDLGDNLNGGGTVEYQGTVTISTVTYLVFAGGGATALVSPTQPIGSFPSTYQLSDYPINPASTPLCFAAGTLIATPLGERLVETLTIGDRVTTAGGAAVPVKWIGRQSVQKFFAGERARPVRVAAGALGNGLPHSDLVLTADHALILDGLAINAGALVNGTTIARDPMHALPDRVTYYHVETEAHDVILANGAAAETYVDYIGRAAFDNHGEYRALYGEDRTITEMPLPRISAARLVPPAIRARLGLSSAAA